MRGSEYVFWFVVFFWMVLYLLPEGACAWPLSLDRQGSAPPTGVRPAYYGSEASRYLEPYTPQNSKGGVA
jgi:hypothetical protein